MLTRDLVVIGTSLGGVQALPQLMSVLPKQFPATVLAVQHLSADFPSEFPSIVQRRCALRVAFAADGDLIEPGRVFIAPPDFHLEVTADRLRLSHGPKQNRSRPAIDPLFCSAALVYGPRVIGVLLTGMLDDGTVGLNAIKVLGGLTLVQDPLEAVAPHMPVSALQNVVVDFCLPLAALGAKLVELAGAIVPGKGQTSAPSAASRGGTGSGH